MHLADRTLMPGDVVRRMIKGKDTQRGYCRDIELTACIQIIGTKQVLTNIKSEDLVPLEVCNVIYLYISLMFIYLYYLLLCI